jgi:hypothetical protein
LKQKKIYLCALGVSAVNPEFSSDTRLNLLLIAALILLLAAECQTSVFFGFSLTFELKIGNVKSCRHWSNQEY